MFFLVKLRAFALQYFSKNVFGLSFAVVLVVEPREALYESCHKRRILNSANHEIS